MNKEYEIRPDKAKMKVGGKFFKYVCPVCKAEYMKVMPFCVKCGIDFDGAEKGGYEGEKRKV